MSGNELKLNYSALVKKVVFESQTPLTVAEITARVHEIRPIETRSPENTIRTAIHSCYLIVNTGGGYAWYPRLLKGARVRTELKAEDLEHRRIIFDTDLRELVWPSFFANQELSDRSPVAVRLFTGATVTLSLDFFGEGIWGARVTRELWRWLCACEVKEGDSLIFEALDAEKRSYRLSLDAVSVRNEAAIRRRTDEIEQAAREYLWNRRSRGGATVWELAKHLLATGLYRHPTPPEPIALFWNRVCGQIDLVESMVPESAGRRRQRKIGKKTAGRIYQLKITLPVADRPVWRRVLVPEEITLGSLHGIIQQTMGWTNSHLHLFHVGDRYYSDPDFELDEHDELFYSEHRMTLKKALRQANAEMLYEYDFGDSWRHHVLLEQILPRVEGELYPRCIDGERSAPPEDCGGFPGYADFLNVIQNEDHPEHESMVMWVGGSFDPERCDLNGINWQLKRSAELSAK